MYVSATEFKNNFGKYMELAKNEAVIITRHGMPELILSGAVSERRAILDSLDGILKYDGDIDDLLKRRLEEL